MIKILLLGMLRAYKLGISPYLGQRCRFYPTCSSYATEAISRHGALKGGILAARRLGHCHPWHPGGFDPVPPAAVLSTTVDPTADSGSNKH